VQPSPSAISSSAWLRARQVAGPAQLVLRQRLAGVAGHGLHQRLLVPALRHPERDLRPAQPLSHVCSASASAGSSGTRISRGQVGRPLGSPP
jgi:hypothetical protein